MSVKYVNEKFQDKEIIMSNKCYAVLLVLAGMVCGILVVSLASSPAEAKLPDEGRVVAKPVPVRATTTPTRPVRPVVARQDIRVYPVGIDSGGRPHAYVFKDGQLYHCQSTTSNRVRF